MVSKRNCRRLYGSQPFEARNIPAKQTRGGGSRPDRHFLLLPMQFILKASPTHEAVCSPSCAAGLRKCLALLISLCLTVDATAGATSKPFVHPLYANNMVLQRDVQNPVWGWTTPGAAVSVTMNSTTYQATAGADGRWQVLLGSLSAGGPYTISISGPQSQTITNVLVGDVYLCSGQSNMAGTLKGINVINLTQEVADSANYPKIRQFSVPTLAENLPQEVPAAGGSWAAPSASTTGTTFSATAYFMAREIYKQQQVPIGIVCSALSGSDIKSWTEPTFAAAFADTALAAYDQTGLAASNSSVSGLYNGMLAPLVPFKIKAAVWYQGEQNATASDQYGRLLPAFMGAVRNLFANQNLPILIIQLPNYGTAQTLPVESSSGWAGIREAQLQSALADPHAATVTTIDLGEAANIHPRDKQDVGLRAANAGIFHLIWK